MVERRGASVEQVHRGLTGRRVGAVAHRGRDHAFGDFLSEIRGKAQRSRRANDAPTPSDNSFACCSAMRQLCRSECGLGGQLVPCRSLRLEDGRCRLNDQANEVTEIDPAAGRPGRVIPVADPYNLYFTPDGRYAVVVAEALQRLDFRDPHTMALRFSLPTPGCRGIDHADFSGDGRYAIFSCEFSGRLIKIDMVAHRILGTVHLTAPSSPQDVKTAPDGHLFYVADQDANGVWLIDGGTFAVTGFVHTGRGAHGLYVSRDSRDLYVTNRLGQSVSVVSFVRHRVVATWTIPHGTPDMGGLSIDGNTLWLSGRYSREVYASDTRTGKLLARIPVGVQPHGLCVYPQPGRYSLGHTGVFR